MASHACPPRLPNKRARSLGLCALLLTTACASQTSHDDKAAAPYGEAVAARFPAPQVHYDTPGLRPGRLEFTTNDELAAALRAAVERAGPNARLLTLGRSQNGVPIEAAVFARRAEVQRPTVLLIGQQHGDEPAGAEALIVTMDALAGGALAPLLDRIDVAVLPRANPDGAQAHDRLTANGIDANRDHLLLRTPEAQAMARVARLLRPAVVVDAHEYTVVGRYLQKFGAVQRHDLLFQHATTANLPSALAGASDAWFWQPLQQALAHEGLTTEWYYTTSTSLEDRRVSMGGAQPDTGRNVMGLKNAVSMLVETRGAGIGRRHLERRVHTHVVAQRSILESAARHAGELMALRRSADAEVAGQACRDEMVVLAGQTPGRRELLFIDPVSGADQPQVVDWNSALQLRTLLSRPRPCGYWLAPGAHDAAQRLRALGVVVQRFDSAAQLIGEAWRQILRSEGPRPDVRGRAGDAGSTIAHVSVALDAGRFDAPAGSYYVPLNQPLANLAIAALEPDSQNSYYAHRLLPTLDLAARVTAPPVAGLTALP